MEKGAIIKYKKENAPKTGDWKYMKPVVDVSKCIGCGSCIEHCPEAAISLRNRLKEEMEKSSAVGKDRKIAEIDFEYCKGCGVCATICPLKAIIMKK
ncbi:MAG TPA: 4Fe-4S binding protein [Candidatus Moranbacteria bacterium]|jgi:pyruvate ferredoxin oxidoreductase delta subunit|nr:4Fe-4S binding protein [Candidatus Moranbacteria bacterium]HOF42712.1 4Fe-4S binding protein [Candidatus Moranbacteria bacterium]HPX94531.1 4Fe-4S binding protein [Candidatus Moranbacteria bacterium]HQB60006.1 4Fe-4S binding protein [Candidatus Moranbacteria bacterium]